MNGARGFFLIESLMALVLIVLSGCVLIAGLSIFLKVTGASEAITQGLMEVQTALLFYESGAKPLQMPKEEQHKSGKLLQEFSPEGEWVRTRWMSGAVTIFDKKIYLGRETT